MQHGRESIYGIKLRREIRLIRGTTADIQRILASCPNAIIVRLKDEQAASKWLKRNQRGHRKVIELEQRGKSNAHRLDDLEEQSKLLNELVTSVKLLAQNMQVMAEEQKHPMWRGCLCLSQSAGCGASCLHTSTQRARGTSVSSSSQLTRIAELALPQAGKT